MTFLMACWSGILATTLPTATEAPPGARIDPRVEERVETLLKQMTLDEKINLLGGYAWLFTNAIPRLGVPSFRMSDGPAGVHNWGQATAFPAPIAVAASWDTDLMRRLGQAFGKEARARGVHVLLAPGVNICRVSRCGRNFEYLGEDPFLASALCVPFIQGVQGEGVIATIKHFAANNQENDRYQISSSMDERTLHEIYLPAFKAAVQEGHIWAVMAAYNRLNEVHCSENDYLLRGVLKGEWIFSGFVMSDWGGTHDGLRAASNGLDLEMPSARYMTHDTLMLAVKKGTITEASIDDKIRRMLRAFMAMGFFDREQRRGDLPQYSIESRRIALEGARKGIVLLKNRNDLLPLDRKKVRSMGVFGPNAHPGVPFGGGSSETEPFRATSTLDGLINATGEQTEIHYLSTQPNLEKLFAESVFVSSADDPRAPAGLWGEYFKNANLEGEPNRKRIDTFINFEWERRSPFEGEDWPPDFFSARWQGFMRAPIDDHYEFICRSDDGVRLFVDDHLIIDEWKDQMGNPSITGGHFGTMALKQGLHRIRLEYYAKAGMAQVRLGWRAQPPDPLKAAADLAAKVDVAVVCVGFNKDTEMESCDRLFELPRGQDDLICSVAAANPNTIVIVNGGGAAGMTRWVEKIGALLQAWYPGQEGGQALAEILFGDVTPAGKLPASFERNWGDTAASKNYPGSDHVCHYREGIFVGYRYFDQAEKKPLFPFGYGLSYTSFEYRNLELDRVGEGNDAVVKVSYTIKNTGSRKGAEISQIYVQDMECSVPRPVKELKGFARVELEPGQSKKVSATLNRSSFAFYDDKKRSWVVEPGEFNIFVGTSSADLKLQGKLQYP